VTFSEDGGKERNVFFGSEKSRKLRVLTSHFSWRRQLAERRGR
jgi:hypothetical protein